MKRTAQQEMKVELAAQRTQLAGYSMQDLLSHAQRSTKAGHNAAYGRDLHLPSRVAHQINRSVAHMAVHWNPAFINGNARRLKLDGLEVSFLEEFLQMTARFRARLADDSQGPSGG